MFKNWDVVGVNGQSANHWAKIGGVRIPHELRLKPWLSFCKSKTLKEWENLFSFSVFDYFNARTSVYLSYLISGYSNIQGYFVPNYSSTDYINENDDSGQKRWIGGNLILLLSTSVTRWPDYLFNIWPFSSEKIDQIA